MCLAVPVRIAELLEGERAVAEIDGVKKEISLALVEGLAAGDYVIVHVGYAISRLDEEEARRTLALFEEVGRLAAETP
jgi:hydrogenase expression/formation protein HypC